MVGAEDNLKPRFLGAPHQFRLPKALTQACHTAGWQLWGAEQLLSCLCYIHNASTKEGVHCLPWLLQTGFGVMSQN